MGVGEHVGADGSAGLRPKSMLPEPNRLELGLESFGGEAFDVNDIVDKVCSQNSDVGDLDFFDNDIGQLESDLLAALEQVDEMSSVVGEQMLASKVENEKLSSDLAALAREQAQYQEIVAKQFKGLERKFGRSSDKAIQIGLRLQHLDNVRGRAAKAHSLLNYFNEIAFEDEVTSPILVDFPRTLVDAAPIVCNLEEIVNDLSMPGIDDSMKRIEQKSSEVLNGLLSEFDKANAEGDLTRMRMFADAVLDNFEHKQGAESLFQRFVFYSLNSLVSARKRSVAFKNIALKDNLAHLFSQIRSVVRTTLVVVSRVFPRHKDDILSLLVSRLFNDPVIGLQPMLSEFLHPSHRGGELPHSEYLQVLVTAHKETKSLVQELGRGLQASVVGEGDPGFDASFIHRQMRTVFQHFTEDYSQRELCLFNQRVSKRLFGALPHLLVIVACPSLEVLPEILAAKRKAQLNADPAVLEEEAVQTKRLEAQYVRNPIDAVEAVLATESDVSLASLMYRTFQLRTSWREDLVAIPLGKLVQLTKRGARWRLEDVDEFDEDAPELGVETQGSGNDLDRVHSLETFSSTLYVLRGVPGQTIRWAYEAHQRCIQLLGNEGSMVANSVAIRDVDENNALFDAVILLFENFCERFFMGTILPVIQAIAASLPRPVPVTSSDSDTRVGASTTSLGFMDELAQHWVVGESTLLDSWPDCLPVLAANNSDVKRNASRIYTLAKSRSDFGAALLPEHLALFIASTHAIEDCVEQGLLYWRDIIHPALAESHNRVSTNQTYMENRLERVESTLAECLQAQLTNVGILIQSCAVALHNDNEYNPEEGSVVEYDQTSPWCRQVAQILEGCLDNYSRLGNPVARTSALLTLNGLVRDTVLAKLKQVNVSLQGSFTLVQDISTLSNVVTGNAFCEELEQVTKTWTEMRLIAQLFIVQPEILAGLLADSDGGLLGVPPRLLLECLSRRADFLVPAMAVSGGTKKATKGKATKTMVVAPWVAEIESLLRARALV